MESRVLARVPRSSIAKTAATSILEKAGSLGNAKKYMPEASQEEFTTKPKIELTNLNKKDSKECPVQKCSYKLD
jgi:hypothetical protein